MPLIISLTNFGSLLSSPALNRRFSIKSTPGANSARRWRIGAIEYFKVGVPLGRPRWLAQTTLAPRSVSQLIVGRAALIRKSSAIIRASSDPDIGTLKSVRTSTVLPRTSPRSSSCGTIYYFSAAPIYDVISTRRFE